MPVVVYICGPLETFLSIMKVFQSEIQDPENYAIFYLDVYADSLADHKPWLNADPDWTDPIAVFKVDIPYDLFPFQTFSNLRGLSRSALLKWHPPICS